MSHHHCLKIVPEEKKYKKCLSKYGMQRLLMAQHGVIDLEPELTSYAHTRALVRQMDLVISIDTSVAPLHIAAHSNWRWRDDGLVSPHYER